MTMSKIVPVAALCFFVIALTPAPAHSDVFPQAPGLNRLQVDSVTIDSIWNSDSGYFNPYPDWQIDRRRDLVLSYYPVGTGKANVSFAVSLDGGTTWVTKPNFLENLDAISYDTGTVQTGAKSRAHLRLWCGDTPNVVIKAVCREYAPVLRTNPGHTMALFDSLAVNSQVTVSLSPSRVLYPDTGYAAIERVFWDVSGDGIWDDSTDDLAWKWNTSVPPASMGFNKQVLVCARDANGLCSATGTIPVAFWLSRRIRMLPVPAGSYLWGADTVSPAVGMANAYGDTVHKVTLSAFYMSETDITQEQQS